LENNVKSRRGREKYTHFEIGGHVQMAKCDPDEDITQLDANNIPGPITRTRARQLNLEVSSFIKPSFLYF
jgi:hypothetical protein